MNPFIPLCTPISRRIIRCNVEVKTKNSQNGCILYINSAHSHAVTFKPIHQVLQALQAVK